MATATTGRYPEHEKLSNVSDESQAIGEFLDLGLPEMGIVLYEQRSYGCECEDCDAGKGADSGWHTSQARETVTDDGRVLLTKWLPTVRTIKAILAEYFEIDQEKIDREKDQILADIRASQEATDA